MPPVSAEKNKLEDNLVLDERYFTLGNHGNTGLYCFQVIQLKVKTEKFQYVSNG